jgi:ribosomal protein L11 methyltransferase
VSTDQGSGHPEHLRRARTWPALIVQRPSPDDDLPDLFQAALTDFDIAAIDESAADGWRVYFQIADERDAALPLLRTQFPDLVLTASDVPDEDWAARSQATLTAIRVGAVTVAPPWDVPKPDAVRRLTPRVTVVIQPSMGFGTGHHATTRLCLAMMQHFELRGITVLDVGTGSGVLAIAASLLGSSFVVGIDHDADAVQSARENLALNPAAKVDLRVVDLKTTVLFRFDLVVANLTGTLLTQTSGRLQDLIVPRGPLILSGFMKEEESAVLAAFPALRVVDRSEEEEWVCVTLQREGTFE